MAYTTYPRWLLAILLKIKSTASGSVCRSNLMTWSCISGDTYEINRGGWWWIVILLWELAWVHFSIVGVGGGGGGLNDYKKTFINLLPQREVFFWWHQVAFIYSCQEFLQHLRANYEPLQIINNNRAAYKESRGKDYHNHNEKMLS